MQLRIGQQYLSNSNLEHQSDIKLDHSAHTSTSTSRGKTDALERIRVRVQEEEDEDDATSNDTKDKKEGTVTASASASAEMNISSRRKLPSFQKGQGDRNGSGSGSGSGGGLVIFYHVAKTGGSTVRSLFEQLHSQDPSYFRKRRYLNEQRRDIQADEDSHTDRDTDIHTNLHSIKFGNSCIPPGKYEKKMSKAYHEIHDLITGQSERVHDFTILWEIHGGSPGLDIIAPYIEELRTVSNEHHKPFFAFTLVRDPLSYTKSYFKYFHIGCDSDWCEHDQYENGSEANLVSAAEIHPNQQCFLLKHSSSIAGLHPSFYNKCQVTETQCEEVYDSMKRTFDWIGTTSKLSFDTIPLLCHMLGCNATISAGRNDSTSGTAINDNINTNTNNNKGTKQEIIITNEKVSNTEEFELSLSKSTIGRLSAVSSLDEVIYKKVRSEFVLGDVFGEVEV